MKSSSKIAMENGIRQLACSVMLGTYVHEYRHDVAGFFVLNSYLILVIYICIYFAMTYAVTSVS